MQIATVVVLTLVSVINTALILVTVWGIRR